MATRSATSRRHWREWNGRYRDTVRDALARRRLAGRPTSGVASPASPISTQATAAARTRASTSSPRTTASRCATSSATSASTTRPTARTTATATTTTLSWNYGVEGATDDPGGSRRCARQQRNLLTTLFLSQGVPMLLAGDELGPHAAGQQQRLLPRRRALLGGLGTRRRTRGAARLHPQGRGGRAPASGTAAPPLVRRRVAAETPAARDIVWYGASGARCAMSGGTIRNGARLGLGLVLGRAGDGRTAASTQLIRRPRFFFCINARPRRGFPAPPRRRWPPAGRCSSTPSGTGRPCEPTSRRAVIRSPRARWRSLELADRRRPVDEVRPVLTP